MKMPSGTPFAHSRSDSRRVLTVAVGLVILSLVLYAPVRHFDFLDYDDRELLVENPPVRDGLTAAGIRWAFTTPFLGNWIPITWISHMLDFTWWGADPGMHHLTSVALHAANAVLLFLVLRVYTGTTWRSAAVAVFFTVHPLRVESVAWISERKDLLMGFFGLLALLAWRRHRRRPSMKWYGLTLLCLGLGLMSKPLLAPLPLLLLLLDYWPLGRGSVGRDHRAPWRHLGSLFLEKAPLLLLSLAGGLVALRAQAPVTATGEQLPFLYRGMNAVSSTLWYLGKTVWPSRLAFFYPHPLHEQSAVAAALGVLLLAAATAAVLRARRRLPYLTVGLFWYLVALAPVAGILQVGPQAHADRYAYLPHLGLFVALVWSTAAFGRRFPRWKRILLPAATLTIPALAAATFHQERFWRDDPALCARALAVTKGNYLAHNNLGSFLARTNRRAAAEEEFRAAIRINPTAVPPHVNLGILLAAEGPTDEAAAFLATALQLDPGNPEATRRLGRLLARRGNATEAIRLLSASISLDPTDASARYDLGLALAAGGRFGESVEAFRAVLALKPDDTEAMNNLGRSLALLGRMAEAQASFTASVALDPGNLAARVNLARAHLQGGRWETATDQLREVLRRDPGHAEARTLLEETIAVRGRAPE